MKPEEIDRILQTTLEDLRLSRSERQALRQVVSDLDLDDDQRLFWRHRAFAIARQAVSGTANTFAARQVLEWVEDVIKTLEPSRAAVREHDVAVHFSPGTECLDCIVRLLRQTRRSVDICVFTITDDRVAEPILHAHKRGVAVRIVSDDDKALDEGSDIYRLRHAGVPVRVDRCEHHMHHKFAIFDDYTVVTGSYNWTRSAATYNRENLILSSDPRLVQPFRDSFEELWRAFE
jgi:phosphatidylserine/phosphatidylglycerophosphate/cardiolipin synthase-like enzyme